MSIVTQPFTITPRDLVLLVVAFSAAGSLLAAAIRVTVAAIHERLTARRSPTVWQRFDAATPARLRRLRHMQRDLQRQQTIARLHQTTVRP